MVSFKARAIPALSAVVAALLLRGSLAQADCDEESIGNSRCESDNNSEECSYDGGDCCASTCPPLGTICGANGFDCRDPDAADFGDQTDCNVPFIGSGICEEVNNNAGCGYDCGDCCESTCDPEAQFPCGLGPGYDCVDPNAEENGGSPGAFDPATCSYDDSPCSDGDALCGDPHMQGLRGQRIDWSGVDGGWYSLVRDADVQLNIRLTAPLPDEFPDRQLMTGVAIMSGGHSLVIEVNNPHDVSTDGCPTHVSPCLANGGLRVIVDGGEVDRLLQFSREVLVGDGTFLLSASNLPVECRQFGGDKVWARMFQEMLRGERELADRSSFEEWVLSFEHMAAPEWCAKYIVERGLADAQSTHALFKIETSTITVRLNVGTNFQGGGEQDWDGRVLPDLEFWQMDVGVDGLDIEDPGLSGILGETARPVYDENGLEVMEGFEAFRGTVEDYRVSDALGTHFTLLENAGNIRK